MHSGQVFMVPSEWSEVIDLDRDRPKRVQPLIPIRQLTISYSYGQDNYERATPILSRVMPGHFYRRVQFKTSFPGLHERVSVKKKMAVFLFNIPLK